jgi:hypothetical protein
MSRATAESSTRPTHHHRRLVATACLGLIALMIAGFSWHATSLRGIPDIGEPFDVAAFSAVKVADEDNAYVLYRQAAAKVVDTGHLNGNLKLDWATAPEIEKRWLEENREALQIWRLGTERPDSSLIDPAELTFDTNLEILQVLRDFCRLAQLEGSRLEAAGDYRAAWGWYRAILRSSRHCGRRGTMIERLVGVAIYWTAAFRITNWARNPKVDAASLREALTEIQAIDLMTPPTSDTVKCEYLSFIQTMERPGVFRKLLKGLEIPYGPNGVKIPDGAEWKTGARSWLEFQAFYKREPERSRRLFRLVAANWLESCDLPKSRRPPMLADRPLFSVPAAPEHLSAEALRDWIESTIILKSFMPAGGAMFNAVDRERGRQAQLVVDVASQLYQREHGDEPDDPAQLVGPYLKSLPEGYAPAEKTGP